MPDSSPQARLLDALLALTLPKDDFVDYAQSPKHIEALPTALSNLIDNWPTDDQIKILSDRINNPDRARSITEKDFIAELKAGRSIISAHNSQETSLKQQAEMFWELSQHRPIRGDAYNRWKDSVDDVFGRSLYLISLS